MHVCTQDSQRASRRILRYSTFFDLFPGDAYQKHHQSTKSERGTLKTNLSESINCDTTGSDCYSTVHDWRFTVQDRRAAYIWVYREWINTLWKGVENTNEHEYLITFSAAIKETFTAAEKEFVMFVISSPSSTDNDSERLRVTENEEESDLPVIRDGRNYHWIL